MGVGCRVQGAGCRVDDGKTVSMVGRPESSSTVVTER